MQPHSAEEKALLKSALWIAGPTASGKSALALELAHAMDGEIISVDSMQVYRGMDIGTAKPTKEEQQQVRHHMIDLVEVDVPFDVARFRREALLAALNIANRQRRILFCGGTGFYFQALIQGIGHAPPSDTSLREALNEQSIESLLDELAGTDPATFERIDRQNKRKIVRALEVVRLTGKSFTTFKSDWTTNPLIDPSRFWILEQETDALRERINQRVDTMIKTGWIDETKRLLETGLRKNTTACQAIGYRQIMDYLNDKLSLEETISLIKTKTWQFAKRQRTWFRHQARGTQIQMTPGNRQETIKTLIQKILREPANK